MTFRDRLYNGWAEILGGSGKMTNNRRRTAWYLCTVSTMLYAVTLTQLLHFAVERKFSVTLVDVRYVVLVVGIAVFVLSDPRFDYGFFGAKARQLSGDEVGAATMFAFFFTFLALCAFVGAYSWMRSTTQ